MRNLKVWQKLAVLVAVLMVPLAVVTWKMASSITEVGVTTARMEVSGLEYYVPSLKLMSDLQMHRGLSQGWLGGAKSFKDALAVKRGDLDKDIDALSAMDARLGGALQTTERWNKLRTAVGELLRDSTGMTADQSFAQHSRVIGDIMALIDAVAHTSKLTVDPNIDSKRLIDVLVSQGLELSESLARARGFGLSVAASGKRTAEQIEQLNRESVLVEFVGAKMDQSVALALEDDPELRARLETPAGATTDAVLQSSAEISGLARDARVSTTADAYFEAVTRGVDAIAAFQMQIVTTLRAGLEVRIASLQREIFMTLAWAGLGLLAVALIGILIMRDITVTLRSVIAVANRIAIGDLAAPVPTKARKDELGVLANSFTSMVGSLKETVGVAERIAAGDLSVVVTPRSDQDVLGKALANMVERLSALVGDVQRSGIQVNTSVNQISATAKQQQATATEIAATTSEISATSKTITTTSRDLVKTMNEVAGVAEDSAALAGNGQAGLARMEQTMHHIIDAAGSINARLTVLNEKAGGITQVVTTITKVADQTNLLSLNAAIEAEKAGEYGRGFAVVATEIRRLADQTGVATYDIEQMVKEIQSAVSAGVMGMDKFSEQVRRGMQEVQQVGEQLSKIIAQVQALAPRFESVNEGMQAQAAGAEQITVALAQLGEAVHQAVESLTDSNQAIDGLNRAAIGMRGGVDRFRIAA